MRIFCELALIHDTPNSNRSTAINFVHDNGRPLYTVDWRMVVVEGENVLGYTM